MLTQVIYMNKIILFLFTLSLLSCKKICAVTSVFCEDKIEESEPIDFTQIDEFPKFKNCKDLLNYQENKTCFETTLHTKITKRIQNLRLKAEQTLTDTISIYFSINKEGRFICNEVKTSDSTKLVLPNLTAEIQEIIHGLAPVAPAQKRGIYVTTSYNIPLLIQTE